MKMKWLARLILLLPILIVSCDSVRRPTVFAQNSAQKPITIIIVQHQTLLTWPASATSGVVGYNVFRSTTNGGPYTQINGSTVAATTYTDFTVLAGLTYYYVVDSIASDGVTQGPYSPQCSGTVPTP